MRVVGKINKYGFDNKNGFAINQVDLDN